MSKDNALELLQKLGLNQYESKTYLALAKHGTLAAGKVSELAKIPRPRVYDVLSKLEKEGFVLVQSGRPVKYQARDISEAVKLLKERKLESMNSHLSELASVGEKINEHIRKEQPSLEAQALGTTWTLKGRNSIYSALQNIISTSKSNVVISTTPAGLERKNKALMQHLREAKGRGVKLEVITHMKESNAQILKSFGDTVHKVTHSDDPYRFVLADDEHAVLFLTPEADEEKDSELAVWLKSAEFNQAFRKLINK